MYWLRSNLPGSAQKPPPIVPCGMTAIIGRPLASICWAILATETSSGRPCPSAPRPRSPGVKPWRWKSTSTVSALSGSAPGIRTTARPARRAAGRLGRHARTPCSTCRSPGRRPSRRACRPACRPGDCVTLLEALDRDALEPLPRRVLHLAWAGVPRLRVDALPAGVALEHGARPGRRPRCPPSVAARARPRPRRRPAASRAPERPRARRTAAGSFRARGARR